MTNVNDTSEQARTYAAALIAAVDAAKPSLNPGDTVIVRANKLTTDHLVVGVEDQFFGVKFPHEYIVEGIIEDTFNTNPDTKEPGTPDYYISLRAGGRDYVEPFVLAVRGDVKFRTTI